MATVCDTSEEMIFRHSRIWIPGLTPDAGAKVSRILNGGGRGLHPRPRPPWRPRRRNRRSKRSENGSLIEWTRSQPIRTAAEVPLRFSLLETRPSFAYQRIAREAVRLRALGMPNCAIAVQLGVTDKTVAKACHWVQKGRVSAHSGR